MLEQPYVRLQMLTFKFCAMTSTLVDLGRWIPSSRSFALRSISADQRLLTSSFSFTLCFWLLLYIVPQQLRRASAAWRSASARSAASRSCSALRLPPLYEPPLLCGPLRRLASSIRRASSALSLLQHVWPLQQFELLLHGGGFRTFLFGSTFVPQIWLFWAPGFFWTTTLAIPSNGLVRTLRCFSSGLLRL